MPIRSLRAGSAIKLKATFTVNSIKTDPTTVKLEVKDPSGNIDSYTYAEAEVTKVSTGIYTKIVTLDEAGWWIYEWHGEGAVVVVDGNQIQVETQSI